MILIDERKDNRYMVDHIPMLACCRAKSTRRFSITFTIRTETFNRIE